MTACLQAQFNPAFDILVSGDRCFTGETALTGAGMSSGSACAGTALKTVDLAMTVAPLAGGVARSLSGTAERAAVDAGERAAGQEVSAVCKVLARHSFVPSTLVVLADGTWVPVSDVKVGDLVQTMDTVTGRVVVRPVIVLHRNLDSDLVEVTVIDSRGEASVVRTTEHHPFWNVSRDEWSDAVDLGSGDRLFTADGEAVTVTGVRTVDGSAWMYDLTIADTHTYYIHSDGHDILVHNNNIDDCAKAATEAADELVDLTGANRSHILDGEVRPNGTYSGGHRPGTGYPGKSEFPAGWSDDQIIHNISDVATDPASVVTPKGGADFVTGTRSGVDIEVIIRNGQIKTGYPTNLPRNP
jgi:Pretoxin HINT domain/Bacterial EndoU nuclease